MRTIAIIPCYNEEKTIREIITRCKEVNVYPLIVDDGSTNNTFNIANSLTKVLIHKVNLGKGETLDTGFQYIRNLDFKYVVIIDADLQFNPYEIPKLIEGLKDADYVIGQRNWKQVPFRHYLGNLVWIKTFNFLYKTDLKDTNCGFVAMKKGVMLKLKVSSGYVVDNDMLIQVIRMGYKIKNVPISVNYDYKRGLSGIRMVVGILIFIIKRRINYGR